MIFSLLQVYPYSMLNFINKIKEKQIHQIFEISVILKGLHAIIEIIGGVFAFFVTKAFIISTVLMYTQEELTEDPKDFIAHYFITQANNLSLSTKYFVALYLLSHGVIKLLLVVGLLRKKLWAYPTSIVVFSLFILYQIYKFYYSHSIGLVLLTLLDVFIIILTVHEYRYMKSHHIFDK